MLPPGLCELTSLVTLRLDGNQLTELPTELGQLRSLTTLRLDGNQLTELPTELGQLTSLTTLRLDGNQLTELPTELGQLTSLTQLYLHGNKLTELKVGLGQLTSLTHLYLHNNQLHSLPAELRHLTSLSQLYLHDNRLGSLPAELGRLTSLTTLRLDGNQLTELPPELGQLVSLTTLRLDGNRLTELPPELGQLTGLTALSLGGNQLTELPAQLGQLTGLTELYVHDNQLTELPAELGRLTALTELYLHGNQLTEVPAELGQLMFLTELYLHGNQLTELPAELGQLTGLTELYLYDNQLRSVPAELGLLASLTTLRLDGNQLSEVPAELGRLTCLTQLWLYGNRLTCIPPELGELTSLNQLWLHNNMLAALPPSLGRLASLTQLWLQGNLLQEIPAELGQLTALTQLYLYDNHLSSIPAELGQLASLTQLYLYDNYLTAIPAQLGKLASLTQLWLHNNRLTLLPAELGRLTSLTQLWLHNNELSQVPAELGWLTSLTALRLDGNKLTELPSDLGQLRSLTTLRLDGNKLANLPAALGQLACVTQLHLHNNELTAIPAELGRLTALTELWLQGNRLSGVPAELGRLTALTQLWLQGNRLSAVPAELGRLTALTELYLYGNQLTELPEELGRLTALTHLWLQGNRLSAIPAELGQLTALTQLYLHDNHLTELPAALGQLTSLVELRLSGNQLACVPFSFADLGHGVLRLGDNPLAPEIAAAYEDSSQELHRLLSLLRSEGRFSYQAKLVLVGEGAVGKTSLLAAMRAEPWVDGRPTTHGVEIKPVVVRHGDAEITLNGWDFGGQDIYRPTHQLYFSSPAVYLVVWNPRLGPELCQVDYWITLIKNRAGETARIHVVATHAGQGEHGAWIDESGLRKQFGTMIAGFHHVDSSDADRVATLMAAVARTAAELPHVGRWYPQSWQDLRDSIRAERLAYLSYTDFEKRALASGLSATSTRSLVTNASALGHWIFYDEPDAANLIIFQPDWLSKAMSFILNDPDTRAAHGLITHQRMGRIWATTQRPAQECYPPELHPAFRHLMSKFDIAYQVATRPNDQHQTLIAQLVGSVPPTAQLAQAWDAYGLDLDEGTQVCDIRDLNTGEPVVPEGLMYQLIVRFHPISMGARDHRQSVHWQRGLIVDDGHHGRGLIVMKGNRVTVTVRAAYPHNLLARLTEDIRRHVEDFWLGVDVRVMVPCGDSCPVGQPGRGLFDTESLVESKKENNHKQTCNSCFKMHDIDALMSRVTTRRVSPEQRLARAVAEALSPAFAEVITLGHQIRSDVAEHGMQTRRAISQAELQFRELLNALDDPARDGPRLITLEQMDATLLRPQWTSVRVRATLWCEHSRQPLHTLSTRPDAGVYILTVPRDWMVKAAPLFKALSILLRGVLPVVAGLDLALPGNSNWVTISEHLHTAEAGIGGIAQAIGGQAADVDAATPDRQVAATDTSRDLDSSSMRSMHSWLRAVDPSFGGLERVNDRGRYKWIHPQFLPNYHDSPGQ